jgi:DUF1680 family protein
VVATPAGWDGALSQPAASAPPPSRRPVALTAVPYFSWANRQPGQMAVWLRQG